MDERCAKKERWKIKKIIKVHFLEHGETPHLVVIAKEKEGLDKLYAFSFFFLLFLRSCLGSFLERERERKLAQQG